MTEENLAFLSEDFEIVEKLGKGGMGQVFKARQKSLDRMVAIKILPIELCKNKEFIGRFKREARLAGKFYHPHSIQVYDIGENKGQYYYIMEYVSGGTLKELLAKEGRLSEDYVIKVLREVLSVLKEAESMKIIHRDIKPDNIMLTADGTIKIADLGLAREEDDDAGLTQQKIAIGTPHYMAPEQAQGKQVDTRADQYALGVTAFHLLTGVPPFSGKNNMEILVQHVKTPMPKPSGMSVKVSPLMDKLVLKMTEKDPSKRFQKIDDILKAIDKVEANLKVPGKDTKAGKLKSERTSVLSKRREKNSFAGIFVLLLMVLVVGLVYILLIDQGGGQSSLLSKEEVIQLAKTHANSGNYKKGIEELNSVIKTLPASEIDELVQVKNEISKQAVQVSVDKIMAKSKGSIENCEKGIIELESLMNEYGENAKEAIKASQELRKHIVEFKNDEAKRQDQEKVKFKEEIINKLATEVNQKVGEKDFFAAIKLIEEWKTKNIDDTGKVNQLRENVLDLEKRFFDETVAEMNDFERKGEFQKAIEVLDKFLEKPYTEKWKEMAIASKERYEEKLKKLKKKAWKDKKEKYHEAKKILFNMMRVGEYDAAKVKFDLLVKEDELSEEDVPFFKGLIDSYQEIYKIMLSSLAAEMKEKVVLEKIGNKRVKGTVLGIDKGIITYSFMGNPLKLDHLADGWSQTLSKIAQMTTSLKNPERQLSLSQFAYVNGDLMGAYHFYQKSVGFGLDEAKVSSKYKVNVKEDFLDWLDQRFSEALEKGEEYLKENKKDVGLKYLNQFIEPYLETEIYQDRQAEVEALKKKLQD